MDYITACYYSRMRPYRDRPDISVAGRWRWCPPDAQVIPYLHKFGSHTMDWGEERLDPPVGEVPARNGRSRGESSPRFTGQHFCGSEEDWTQGTLYATHVPPAVDADGVPLCCMAPPIGPGGFVLNGSAEQRDSGGGGGELGGSGVLPEGFDYPAEGGGELGGSGLLPYELVYHADGGVQAGGTSPPIGDTPGDPTPSDLEIGGDGSKPLQRIVEADGGGELGGDGSKPLQRIVEADGGGELGESGSEPFGPVIRADGGGELGESSVPFKVKLHADGGLEIGPGATADAIRVGICEKPTPNPLRYQLFAPNAPVNGCEQIFQEDPLFLHWQPALAAFVGTRPFGHAGRRVTLELSWIGPEEWDWRLRLRFSSGTVLDTFGSDGGFACEPFTNAFGGFPVSTAELGCVEAPVDVDYIVNVFQ